MNMIKDKSDKYLTKYIKKSEPTCVLENSISSCIFHKLLSKDVLWIWKLVCLFESHFQLWVKNLQLKHKFGTVIWERSMQSLDDHTPFSDCAFKVWYNFYYMLNANRETVFFSPTFELELSDFLRISYTCVFPWLNRVQSMTQRICKVHIFKDLRSSGV
jgi:hypothetical protein